MNRTTRLPVSWRTRRSLVAAAVAVTLVAAACGGDDAADDPSAETAPSGSTSSEPANPEPSEAPSPSDGDTPGSTAAAETTDPGAVGFTGDPVTLMVLAPLENAGANAFPEVRTGVQAAAAVLNSRGGINGSEVLVEVCDTGRDANVAVNCAQKAVDSGYLAVVGAQDNDSTYAAILTEAGIPNVAPYASAPLLADPNTFMLFGGQLMYFIGGLTQLAATGAESIAVVYQDEPGGPVGNQLGALGGLLAVAHPDVTLNLIPLSATQGDFSTVVSQAGESDAIYLAFAQPDITIQFQQTAEQLAVDKPTGVPSVVVQGTGLEDLGAYSEGLYAAAGFDVFSTDDPMIADFQEAMFAIEPDENLTDLGANSYAGTLLVGAALDGADANTAENLTTALNSLDGLELGLLPAIQFSQASQLLGPDVTRIFSTHVLHVQVQDGEIVPTGGFVDFATGAPIG